MIADARVFHIADPNFLEMYNNQSKPTASCMDGVLTPLLTVVIFELARTNAWKDNGSREVIAQVPKRLRAEGWDAVRLALSLTVR